MRIFLVRALNRDYARLASRRTGVRPWDNRRMKNKQIVSVRLAPGMIERIEAEAEARDLNRSELVRLVIALWLDPEAMRAA